MRESRRAYNSWRWKKKRREVLLSAGFRCASCGGYGRLEADHIQPRRLHKTRAEFWDMKNLQALCYPCHFAKCDRERGWHLTPGAERWKHFMRTIS